MILLFRYLKEYSIYLIYHEEKMMGGKETEQYEKKKGARI